MNKLSRNPLRDSVIITQRHANLFEDLENDAKVIRIINMQRVKLPSLLVWLLLLHY